jgi:hypothetical protein
LIVTVAVPGGASFLEEIERVVVLGFVAEVFWLPKTLETSLKST